MKKRIITISGNIAAGKSEIAEKLANILNMEVYSASTSFRKLARKYKMSLVDFNKFVSNKPEFDKQIESKTAQAVANRENLILDARLGFYVAPESFKVCIKSNLEVASKRLKSPSDLRGSEEKYETIADARKAIVSRENFERERYKKQYNIDIEDKKNYDLVIDSSFEKPGYIAKMIAEKYLKWLTI